MHDRPQWFSTQWLTLGDAMMTSSNGNIFCVTGPLCGEFTGPGEFLAQRPLTRSFGVFIDLRLNKRLSKQPCGWWFETPAWSLWRHRNVIIISKVISQTQFVLSSMLQNTLDDKSTLIQAMAWCHQKKTWNNVDPDLCRHMASLGHNDFKSNSPWSTIIHLWPVTHSISRHTSSWHYSKPFISWVFQEWQVVGEVPVWGELSLYRTAIHNYYPGSKQHALA